MRTLLIKILFGACFVMQLGGCASTPPEVTSTVAQTNHMMNQLGQEIKRFRTARAVSDAYVLKVSREIQVRTETNRTFISQLLRAEEAAGNTSVTRTFASLKGLTQGLQDDDEALRKLSQDIDKEIAGILTPLPDVPAKLSAASNSLTALGQDLSSRTQLEETLAILRLVRDNTRENFKKLDAATK